MNTPDKEKEMKRRTGGEDIPQEEMPDPKKKIADEERPDFARGMHDDKPTDETPDYARGLREPGERSDPANDYAKGLRQGEKDDTVHPDYGRVDEEEDES